MGAIGLAVVVLDAAFIVAAGLFLRDRERNRPLC